MKVPGTIFAITGVHPETNQVYLVQAYADLDSADREVDFLEEDGYYSDIQISEHAVMLEVDRAEPAATVKL